MPSGLPAGLELPVTSGRQEFEGTTDRISRTEHGRAYMYVSPAVRSIREDPVAGESVTLLVEAADDADALAAAIEEVGTVEAELQFDTLRVAVLHERVDEVCELDGVVAVETANTLVTDPDGAGEDVRFDEG
jgi:hypothetical protein